MPSWKCGVFQKKIHHSDSNERSFEMSMRRDAFTLIELLIVIAIVGLLVSLTLSAVQSSREAARRLDCLNRMRQQTLAVQNFHASFSLIPPNGGPASGNDLSLLGGPAIQPSTFERNASEMLLWGVGDSKRVGQMQTGPWTYSILPQLELGNLHDGTRPVANIPIYGCPSRSDRTPTATVNDLHGEYESGGLILAKTDYAGNEWLMTDRPHWKRFRDVQDGLSNTIAIGEKAYDPTVQTPSSWYWDEPIWIGGSNGTVRRGKLIVPDLVGIPYRDNWGSAHIAGANFAMVDGSARFIASSIEVGVLGALLTPADQDGTQAENK